MVTKGQIQHPQRGKLCHLAHWICLRLWMHCWKFKSHLIASDLKLNRARNSSTTTSASSNWYSKHCRLAGVYMIYVSQSQPAPIIFYIYLMPVLLEAIYDRSISIYIPFSFWNALNLYILITTQGQFHQPVRQSQGSSSHYWAFRSNVNPANDASAAPPRDDSILVLYLYASVLGWVYSVYICCWAHYMFIYIDGMSLHEPQC